MKKAFVFLAVLLIAAILAVPVGAIENLAFKVTESTASTYHNDDYLPSNVCDGLVWEHEMRLPAWYTDYESEADLTLTWASDVTIAKAILYDLTSAEENVESGTMTFSDGTKVEFGALNPDGTATEIPLPKTITTNSVVIHIVADIDTMHVGLDEVELFDPSGKNVAPEATAQASSVLPDGDPYWYIPEAYTGWHVAQKAINGVASVNRPQGAENEWASLGEPLPWIDLRWSSAIQIGTIALRDRIGDADWIMTGDITFSDGTVISFDGLDNNGAPLYVDIPDITAESFMIQVTESEGPNPGFAEIEVYTEHFRSDGTPIITEAVAPDVAELDDGAEAPAVTAPATADAGITLALLSFAAAAVLARKKGRK
ncbi:MAG: hypothetical protein PHZ09_05280 [Eubacteriales bacterium]|nr:hypothetical protein [Eubacteriales bacterium]